MKFLAVDTSGAHLTVVACNGEESVVTDVADCMRAHSVRLMEEIDRTLNELRLTPADCDFFGCVVGAGSFTGIRIGIATVKGLCFAVGKPALAVTSFDALAYAEEGGKLLALVDAGHGAYYACGYTDGVVTVPPAYCGGERVRALRAEGYELVSGEALPVGSRSVDGARGLLNAVRAKSGQLIPARELEALYLRKSSAEEGR